MILFVLLLSDGVPGSQSVTEEFALDWPQVLSGTHNMALAWVDGRSGVGRGQKTTAVDSRKLGSLRVKDYLGVVQSVQLRNSIKLYNGHVRVIKLTGFYCISTGCWCNCRTLTIDGWSSMERLRGCLNLDTRSSFKAVKCFSCSNSLLFLPPGLRWLLSSQDVGYNR